MATVKCKAADPTTCRYHGTLENHTEQMRTAYHNYIVELRNNLSQGSSHDNILDKAREQYLKSQASFDSHDENYFRLLTEYDQLEKYAEKIASGGSGENPEQYVAELKERVVAAQEVRTKRDTSEETEGWLRDTTANLPIGARLSTGEKIVGVRRRVGLPANKREVVLEKQDGTLKAAIWGSYTKIAYLPPSEEDQPEGY